MFISVTINRLMKWTRCWQWKLVSTGCFSSAPLISESQEVFVRPCVQTESLWYSDKAPSWLWPVSTFELIMKRDRFSVSDIYWEKCIISNIANFVKYWSCWFLFDIIFDARCCWGKDLWMINIFKTFSWNYFLTVHRLCYFLFMTSDKFNVFKEFITLWCHH